jgi:hypothetical protein
MIYLLIPISFLFFFQWRLTEHELKFYKEQKAKRRKKKVE